MTGLLGTLGWVGFKQLPSNSVSAAPQVASDEEATTFEALAAETELERFPDPEEDLVEAAPSEPRQPANAANPFSRTTAVSPAPASMPAARGDLAQDRAADDDANPFARAAVAARPEASPPRAAAQRSTAVPAEFTATAEAVTKVQPAAAASSTIAADFDAESAEPEVDEFEADPFAAAPPASATASATPTRAVERSPFPKGAPEAAEANEDLYAFDLSDEAPAGNVEVESSAPRAPGGVAFQFDEAPAQAEPEEELEPAPAQPPATDAFGGGFQFEEAPEASPSDSSAFEPSPAVQLPDLDEQEPAAPPRSFSAPFEPQEISPAAAVTNNPKDEKVHVVQPGENYWSIARQHYSAGRYFSALAEYNKPRIADAKQLKPGMKVLIPSAGTLEQRFAKVIQPGGPGAGKPKQKAGLFFDRQQQPFYCVGASDTLGTISQRHLGRFARWSEIYDLNRDQLKSPDALKLGMILKMPGDASELAPAAAVPVSR